MASFDRRTVIGAVLSAAAMPGIARAAGPIPASNNLHFNILRNGKPFGQYRVAFVAAGDLLTVTTDVAMNMSIAKVTVFDYVHHCEEQWRGGRFTEMRSHTVRDKDVGRAEEVVATRDDFGIHIKTRKDQLSAPPKATPLTHWNQSTLSGPLFNPQDGLMLDLRAQQIGRDAVPLANGTQLVGAHWTLRGAQTLDEWYDDAGVWAGIKAVFPDKSLIEYRRV